VNVGAFCLAANPLRPSGIDSENVNWGVNIVRVFKDFHIDKKPHCVREDIRDRSSSGEMAINCIVVSQQKYIFPIWTGVTRARLAVGNCRNYSLSGYLHLKAESIGKDIALLKTKQKDRDKLPLPGSSFLIHRGISGLEDSDFSRDFQPDSTDSSIGFSPNTGVTFSSRADDSSGVEISDGIANESSHGKKEALRLIYLADRASIRDAGSTFKRTSAVSADNQHAGHSYGNNGRCVGVTCKKAKHKAEMVVGQQDFHS